MKLLFLIFTTVALLSNPPSAKASANQPGENLASHVSVSKLQGSKDHFIFSVCQANNCERIGSEQGYTAEQIESLNGRWQMLGSSVMGVGEGLVVVYTGAAGVAVGAGYSSFALLVGGGAVGVAAPVAAIRFIKAINPLNKYRDGSVKTRMENSVSALVADGRASVVLFQSTDLKHTLAVAERVNQVLGSL